MVYLKLDDVGSLKVIAENSSIIEIAIRSLEDSDYLEYISNKFGNVYAQYFEAEGYLWHVLCDPLEGVKYCEGNVSSTRTAFNKNKLIGRPPRPPQL